MSKSPQSSRKFPPDLEERSALLKKREKIEDLFYGIMIIVSFFTGIVSLVIMAIR